MDWATIGSWLWENKVVILEGAALLVGGPYAIILNRAAKEMGEMFNEQKQSNQDIKGYALESGKKWAVRYLQKRLQG